MAVRRAAQLLTQILHSVVLGVDVVVFYPILAMLPFGWGYPVTRLRGTIQYLLMKNLRRQILSDLAECIPELADKGLLEKAAKRVLQMQSTFFYDSYILVQPRVRRLMNRYGSITGREHLDRSRAFGNGVLLCTMHFNHYFYPAGILLWHDYPLCAYAVWPWDLKKVNFFIKLHHWFTFKLCILVHNVHMVWAGRHHKGEIQECLRNNHPFYVLLDIPLPDKDDLEEVVFFGKPAYFPSRILDVAYATKAPLHIEYMFRSNPRDWRRQTAVISAPVELKGDKKEDLQRIVSLLEEAIRAHPDHWWGWGQVRRMRPESVRQAKRSRDYSLKSTPSTSSARAL